MQILGKEGAAGRVHFAFRSKRYSSGSQDFTQGEVPFGGIGLVSQGMECIFLTILNGAQWEKCLSHQGRSHCPGLNEKTGFSLVPWHQILSPIEAASLLFLYLNNFCSFLSENKLVHFPMDSYIYGVTTYFISLTGYFWGWPMLTL